MKHFIKILFLLLALLIFSCGTQKKQTTKLFNGKDLNHWQVGDEGFEIVDKKLYTGTFKKGDNIFTKKEYANFILKLEYNLSAVGNSGVLIRCKPENPWGTGVEVQLLAPWTPRRDDLHCTGSIYGFAAVKNRPDETPNTWHSMEIQCDRKLITVLVDGNITTVADTDTIVGMKNKLLKGVIGLQVNHAEEEGQYTQFRNISITDMDLEPNYVIQGFHEEDVQLRTLAYESAVSLGLKIVKPLSLLLNEKNTIENHGAKQVLFDIAVKASSKEEKEALLKELNKSSKEVNSQYAHDYIDELIRMLKY